MLWRRIPCHNLCHTCVIIYHDLWRRIPSHMWCRRPSSHMICISYICKYISKKQFLFNASCFLVSGFRSVETVLVSGIFCCSVYPAFWSVGFIWQNFFVATTYNTTTNGALCTPVSPTIWGWASCQLLCTSYTAISTGKVSRRARKANNRYGAGGGGGCGE